MMRLWYSPAGNPPSASRGRIEIGETPQQREDLRALDPPETDDGIAECFSAKGSFMAIQCMPCTH